MLNQAFKILNRQGAWDVLRLSDFNRPDMCTVGLDLWRVGPTKVHFYSAYSLSLGEGSPPITN